MKYHIHKTVVIGSGTMGAAIAAHLANAGVLVTLLDIVPKDAPVGDREARNKIVNEGWDRCLKAKPANLMSADLKTFVKLGNLQDDFGVIAEADWICEAIVENLKIKQDLMARIDEVRKPTGIVTTNTSGIPVAAIAEGRSDGFKKRFLGTHFFNPPRYLKLLEIIPTQDTDPQVVEFFSRFGEYRLGKGIVLCKDTPNFIGNRVAFGTGAFALDYILKNGYTVDEVDAITGPLIGRQNMSKLLKNRGYEVTAVNSGDASIRELQQGHFDVIVLDLKMPGMDGIATLKEIMKLGLFTETLILTGTAPSTRRSRP